MTFPYHLFTQFQSATEPTEPRQFSTEEKLFIRNLRAGRTDAAAQWFIEQMPVKDNMSKDLSRISLEEKLLIIAYRSGKLDILKELAEGMVDHPQTYDETPPLQTWRDKVIDAEHYLIAFGIAGALVRNCLVDIDLHNPNWHHVFCHAVSVVEEALNALDN